MTVNIEAYTTLVYTATRALDGLMGTKLIFCTLKYDIEHCTNRRFTLAWPFTLVHPVIHYQT